MVTLASTSLPTARTFERLLVIILVLIFGLVKSLTLSAVLIFDGAYWDKLKFTLLELLLPETIG